MGTGGIAARLMVSAAGAEQTRFEIGSPPSPTNSSCGNIKRMRRARRTGSCACERTEVLITRLCSALPLTQTRQTPIAGLAGSGLSRLQPVQIEADIGPAGRLRRHMGDAALGSRWV